MLLGSCHDEGREFVSHAEIHFLISSVQAAMQAYVHTCVCARPNTARMQSRACPMQFPRGKA